MKLLICESPAKTDKIAKYAGAGYKCVASFGHITQLNKLAGRRHGTLTEQHSLGTEYGFQT